MMDRCETIETSIGYYVKDYFGNRDSEFTKFYVWCIEKAASPDWIESRHLLLDSVRVHDG